MYYKRCGQGAPVVYLHGWGCDGSIFDSVVERLPDFDNFQVDWTGFGKSDMPPSSGWTVEDYAEELRAFLQAQGLTDVTLVGHSFGCRVALVIASTYPELVSRMLLVAPAGLRKFSLSRWWKVTKYKLSKLLGKLTGKQAVARYASDDYSNCPVELRATFVKVINADLSRYARRIQCPVIIVNGRDDTATPLSHAKRLNRLIKGSHLVTIEGDHFAFFRAPVALAKTIHNFVE